MEMAKESEEGISATDIIRNYLNDDLKGNKRVLAKSTFEALCLSFKNVSVWGKGSAMGDIMNQLQVDGVPLLDHRCSSLIYTLLSLDLCELSGDNRRHWCNLLSHVAVDHLCWTDIVLNQFCKRLAPEMRKIVTENGTVVEGELWPEEDTKALYTEVLLCLQRIMSGFPPLVPSVKRALVKSFPFMNRSVVELKAYFLNVLHFASVRVPPDFLAFIWKLLIERLVDIDSQRTIKLHKKAQQDQEGFFTMDEDLGLTGLNSEVQILTEKLDSCLSAVLRFLQYWCFIDFESDSCEPVGTLNMTTTQKTMECLFVPLNKFLLSTHDPKHTPFLWFLLCSFDWRLCDRMLRYLWKEVETPGVVGETQTQHDRRSHSSACYMAGLIARGRFVHVSVARYWISVWSEWTRAYLDAWESPGSVEDAGGLRSHGTFYAISHAIFFVTAFRYKELLGENNAGLEEMRGWGLDRLAHCSLNPFRFCAPQVVINFANVCRDCGVCLSAMQLVYCHHIVEKNNRKSLHSETPMSDQAPFESFFPFDPCDLPETSAIIKPLYRNYEGLSEDTAGTALSEAEWNQERYRRISSSNKKEDFDFVDDLIFSYGKSPGFQNFRPASSSLQDMDTNDSEENLLALI